MQLAVLVRADELLGLGLRVLLDVGAVKTRCLIRVDGDLFLDVIHRLISESSIGGDDPGKTVVGSGRSGGAPRCSSSDEERRP